MEKYGKNFDLGKTILKYFSELFSTTSEPIFKRLWNSIPELSY